MRPCEYPRETIVAAIALVKQLVGDAKPDHSPFSGTAEDVAKMNHKRGRQSVVVDLEGTLASHNREADERANAQ